MMHDFQNALYISLEDTSHAVIFEGSWLEVTLPNLGLGIVAADPLSGGGFQWFLHIAAGEPIITLTEDEGPFGRMPPPYPTVDPSMIGRIDPADSK